MPAQQLVFVAVRTPHARRENEIPCAVSHSPLATQSANELSYTVFERICMYKWTKGHLFNDTLRYLISTGDFREKVLATVQIRCRRPHQNVLPASHNSAYLVQYSITPGLNIDDPLSEIISHPMHEITVHHVSRVFSRVTAVWRGTDQ